MDASTGVWDDTDVKVEGTISCVVVIPEGLGGGWYVGGSFASVNGHVRNRLACINADGTLHAFDPNMNGPVFALALDAIGNLHAGGFISTYAYFMFNIVGIENIQINNDNIKNFSIYPNPSNGVFVVEYNYNEPVQIEIFTINGKLILKNEMTENPSVINLSNQPAVTYLINVSFGNSLKSTRKVIVY